MSQDGDIQIKTNGKGTLLYKSDDKEIIKFEPNLNGLGGKTKMNTSLSITNPHVPTLGQFIISSAPDQDIQYSFWHTSVPLLKYQHW